MGQLLLGDPLPTQMVLCRHVLPSQQQGVCCHFLLCGRRFEPPTTRMPVGCVSTRPLLVLRRRASLLLGAASATDKKPKLCVSV